jgi:hypothetical protein
LTLSQTSGNTLIVFTFLLLKSIDAIRNQRLELNGE